ncbi:CRISPR-associated endonuclease Cas2 [bacterium (Candidatus Howlettbacteria) CG_4_9_14_3_um_filter_37_10]|nr:MAG: CRISPR-associated endonuclease Cas2 [bacterium (Candidatus Howlettbacteria) CG23_combo_of_CG06-09_8_20_14_all_37_9]PJB06474.1 MAG: CRISPR-associated endonuclease Cas2 [bacterium (Candidatus Howlettbacteria) CG_4_9_14_3_um_filter_37_10]
MLSHNPRKFFWKMEKIQKEQSASKRVLCATLSRAKKNGYLKEVEIKNQKILQLTPKGQIKISKHMRDNRLKTWDKKWRILMFDIPEKNRAKRNILRQKLRELGFRQYQLSAWICPFDYTKELEYLINELNLEQYIKYFIGDSIKGEDELKEKFSLN